MKKLMVIGVAALVTMAMAQDKTISYADASVQIAEAAESADTMASVMKQRPGQVPLEGERSDCEAARFPD